MTAQWEKRSSGPGRVCYTLLYAGGTRVIPAGAGEFRKNIPEIRDKKVASSVELATAV